ncbi:MAG: ATP-binding cassette domain-containing protein, partial [Myxococcales bacterium]|nr:ATP-binding cassette domain-containing protein [Myxococcales bacterium]
MEARAEAIRARPLLDARHEVRPGTVAPGELGGEVAIERLRFRYRPDGPYVIDGLSLTVRPGEMVALVGASGCGKSTLVRLLLGFEQPESGQVLYDGHNLAGLDTEAVRRQLGVVLQSGRIGGASVLEVVSGAHRVSLDDAWRALRAAGLAAEIEAMPMGIHTLVGEGGGNLSGGQRQRLLIARALVARPKVLLFDEATSALDNRSQAEVAANLAKLRVTRIVIAHRPSTLRQADRICVLEHGHIVRVGTYDEIYGG